MVRRTASPAARRTALAAVGCAGMLLLAAYGVPQQVANVTARPVEDQVRAAALKYYLGMVFGDYGSYAAAAREPVTVVDDGTVHGRTRVAAQAMLAAAANHVTATKLSNGERNQVATTAVSLVDDAEVTFVGEHTAQILLVTGKGMGPKAGDKMLSLVEHLEGGQWKVIAEIADSKPVPPGYIAPGPAGEKP